MIDHRIALSALGLWCAACGTEAHTVTRRYLSPQGAGARDLPLCIVAGPPLEGLAAQSYRKQLEQSCLKGIREAGLAVREGKDGPCAATSLVFKSDSSGRAESECSRSQYGATANCSSTDIYNKSLHATVKDQRSGQTLVEIVTAFPSGSKYILPTSAFALCRAAFDRYPAAAVDAPLDVSIPEE